MAQIKTYARLKPTKKPYSGYEINKNVLTVHIPDNKDFLAVGSHQALRSNLSYDIMFTDIFRPEASQEDVFDGVAKGIIQSFLNGYNGTIFAYGQTGTGKTYTVEGNSAGYSTRGLSTRALSMIYQQLENRVEDHITVCLSYLEIYQEVAYDLLNPISRSSLPMAPFAKVTVVEGPRGSCIFRGLSLHLAANEEIAQMLLLQGQANRRVAETPVNQRSSRSHAVFTVYLQIRKRDSDVLLNSKLHLVDLAGSERVSKTGVDGQQLTEAKSINLSLHHLETVIIALQTDRSTSASCSGGEKSRGDNTLSQSRSNTSFMSGPSSDNGTKPYRYVPYRNSLLTMVLKDSLGGNCLTAMIATISMEPENLGESISTCRFAQRVARVANNARRNEEVDDKTVIKRLKHKVANLEHQLTVLKSKGMSDSTLTDDEIMTVLSEEDRTVCAKIMEGFLQGVIADPVGAGIYDQSRFRECLHLLKHQYLRSVATSSPSVTAQQVQLHPRQVATDHSSEGTPQLQPNNPHRDSGDHNMSDATQADSSVFVSQQRPPISCSSLLDMHAPEEYFLVSEDQVIGAVPAAEADKKILEKKSSEIEQQQETCPGEKYRGQFDRQLSTKELKKQFQKLTPLEQEQAVKQEQLAHISQDLLMQELYATENNLRLKLQDLEEEVEEQHAYVQELKRKQVNIMQVAREQLVEQHLLRRQSRFRDKLAKLVENKARLQSTLSSMSASVCGGGPRMSVEDKFCHNRQNKGSQMHEASEESQKELSSKPDRDKSLQRLKQQEVQEPTVQDKIREFRHRVRMSQVDPMAGMNMSQCHKVPDKSQVQSSNSVDSNKSLREMCPCSFTSSYLEGSLAVDKESSLEEVKTHQSKGSSRTGLYADDKYYPHAARSLEQEECKTPVFTERLGDECRQVKYGGPVRPAEASTRLELGNYSLKDSVSPYQQQEPSSPSLICEIPPPECRGVLIEMPTLYGAKPVEVRSCHDPHHSHKFALDNVPVECVSVNSSSTEVNNSLNNKNNSYVHVMKNLKGRCWKNINYNTNANTDTYEGFETSRDDLKQHNWMSLALNCGVFSGPAGNTSFAQRVLALCGYQRLKFKDSQCGTQFSIHNQEIVPQDTGREISNLMLMSIHNDKTTPVDIYSEEIVLESFGESSMFTNSLAQCNHRNKVDHNSLTATVYAEHPSSAAGEEMNSFLTQAFNSSLFHQQEGISVFDMHIKATPCHNYSSVSKSSSDHHIDKDLQWFSQQTSTLEKRTEEHCNRLAALITNAEPGRESRTTWNPYIKNASLAQGQMQYCDACSAYLALADKSSTEQETEYTSTGEMEEEDYGGGGASNYGIEAGYADSDLGLDPAKLKIQALTYEESGQVYMLIVGAEEVRAARVRHAIRAAKVIQHHWRAYKGKKCTAVHSKL